MQFAHSGDEDLAGVLIVFALEGGVFVGQAQDGFCQFVFVFGGLWLDGHGDDRVREFHGLQGDGLVLDANLTFDAPWDRNAIESRRPQVTAIDLRLMQANWGQLDLWAAGQLSVDDQGRASGEITLKAKNWREMLDLARQAGWVPEPLVPSIESGLNLVAGMSGSPKTLDAPLTFKDGAVSFGPFRIGTAPKLVLR